ncbi:pantetheine-phosphate adenylyltransferase [Clostridium grantii]|uniref:Phosphopantetheine adenylyltransferase n=1 Tax=Clostridium grantii DSM 8605 TaxID=1121316 RepID=A0A1M5QV63_9CLOT|nr:pantetheine-phosphate adenylyltransferase [Clostridium grantii]SHH17630.1 Phosphopantetheine adenylyltransferase [Clostridium grantii DSM 8605]
MRVAVYPGSFDPITEGHLDIIKRASKMFDELVVLVLINPEKKGLFDIEERKVLIEKVTKNIPNVKVKAFHGLLVNYMKERELNVIIKGLRAVTDFEYEFQMALMNRKLSPTIETVFMMTSAQYSYLSSSSVKQVAKFGGDLNDLVPKEIIDDVVNKILNK